MELFRITKFFNGRPYEDEKGLYNGLESCEKSANKIISENKDVVAVAIFDVCGEYIKSIKQPSQ